MARRSADGTGTIRKKTVTRSGKPYTYWEARYTVGRDPGTGRQLQRSITGPTQRDVAEKLRAVTASLDDGTYTAPSKMTVTQWLDIWQRDYLGSVKPSTADVYRQEIRNHLSPSLGCVKLDSLTASTIQGFYNRLSKPQGGKAPVSPRTVRLVHAVLHRALSQAVKLGYLRFNPSDACDLPHSEKKEIKPLEVSELKAFCEEIRGRRFESLYTVTFMTGLRKSEVMALSWDRIDFKVGTVRIDKQLRKLPGGEYSLTSPKSGKGRTLSPAPQVMAILKRRRAEQNAQRLRAGELWENTGFVFTDNLGHPLSVDTVHDDFKRRVAAIGRPDARFHDLRHTYAVNAIRAGDDIKTIQDSLGHATAAFTLDVYGHVTEDMKQESSQRMGRYLQEALGL